VANLMGSLGEAGIFRSIFPIGGESLLPMSNYRNCMGCSNSAHIDGTLVPGEMPPTAPSADIDM